MTDTLLRMESWPFDSMQAGYDDDGWPIFDRAVGSSFSRMILRQFFSDGIFEKEGDLFWIEPAESGLAINVKPGAAIIRGGIGGLESDTIIQLDATAPVGKTAYSVFARVDDDKDARSLYIHVAPSAGSANPVPPDPELSVNAKELRLGYVILPSNATDMSEAVIVNEQGLEQCPFAAPFAEIDVSGVVRDARLSADRGLADFLAQIQTMIGDAESASTSKMSEFESSLAAMLDTATANADSDLETFEVYVKNYLELVRAAVDGNAVAMLQQQISDIQTSYLSVPEVDELWGATTSLPEFTPMTDSEIDNLFS